MFRWPAILLLCLLAFLGATPAAAQQADVQTSWRLLDYLAVDYPGAVRDGRVVSASEYKEMSEFAASVRERVGALPQKPDKARLVAGADALKAAIGRKAAPDEVAKLAHGLAARLIAAYPVPLAPKTMPDPARGDTLFAENCAACHGAAGDGKGPMAAKLNPPPIAFADRERARQRSLFALYQVIGQGLEGTAMQSFGNLPDADKWALAFRVGRFAYPPGLAEEGRKLWQSDAALRSLVPDAAALTGLTESGLAQRIGPTKAAAIVAYLRNDPGAVGRQGGSSLTIARERLRQSLAAYEAGDREAAKELALAAYLDGFEPIEPMLAGRDAGLLARVETKMGELRGAIAQGQDIPQVRERVAALEALMDESERALAPEQGSAASTFLGAFTILLREGLEALLIVVAMLAFLRKADRAEMVRPVHWGWILALLAGLATWWAATNLIAISGASRELTEGFGSVLAAIVLLFVGIWMHGKAQADEWQRYIHEKVGHALSRKSAWFLFLLAFVAVYREVFETILFFAALSADGRLGALIAGAAAGLGTLALIALLMLRFSRRLPIAKFFSYSSLLIAALAVVLAGKGVAALQEAGLLGVMPVSWAPRISMLGLYPTVQGLVAQAATLAALIVGFGRNRRPANRLATA
ncbi:MAG: high-affinity iron transporter [Sphingomonadales bacterium]|jgi:high-affinity iron transporter|nr:high-affinity iron transporter [Sphingomonadales bacterium]